MKLYKISAVICFLVIAFVMTISASAAQDLTPTNAVHKFDLGSKVTGGSGVEPEGSKSGENWIKVVQSSNPDLKLFNDIGPEVNVTALAVTFEISKWSGKEFTVSWGANIDFFYDAKTTWCGTEAFEGISEYTISGNGEYTLVCNLAAMTSAKGKKGISHMQTCEMVIGNVGTGDTTQINVKSARIYVDGETPEKSIIPAAGSKKNNTAKSSSVTNSEDNDSLAVTTANSHKKSTKDTGEKNSTSEDKSTSTTAVQAIVSNTVGTGASELPKTGAGGIIAFAVTTLAATAIVVFKKK